MMKAKIFFFSLLVAICSSSAVANNLYGELQNNIYTNKFFGITQQFPPSMAVSIPAKENDTKNVKIKLVRAEYIEPGDKYAALASIYITKDVSKPIHAYQNWYLNQFKQSDKVETSEPIFNPHAKFLGADFAYMHFVYTMKGSKISMNYDSYVKKVKNYYLEYNFIYGPPNEPTPTDLIEKLKGLGHITAPN